MALVSARVNSQQSDLASESCWEDLANAVIVQAVEDYLAAHRTLQKFPGNYTALLTQKEVLEFLKSRWYRNLTSVDPSVIVRHLENQTGLEIDF